MADPSDNTKTGTGIEAKGPGAGSTSAPATAAPAAGSPAATPTPISPLADAMAGMVDTSVNRRLGPFRRGLKTLRDWGKGVDKSVSDLRREVADIKARPQTPDPLSILTAAIGEARTKLESLDEKAVKATQAEFGDNPPQAKQ